MRGLKGKRIIIAGAAGGIGEGISLRLAEEGAKLYLADVNIEAVKGVAEKTSMKYGWFDLLQFDSIKTMVFTAAKELGGLDGIVNNAALLDKEAMEKDKDILNMDISLWQRMMNANLIGYAVLCKESLPYLLENEKGGSIVNISSITVHMGDSDEPAYVASKAGVNALTRHIAAKWGEVNIRSNAIAPGCIAHKRFRELTPEPVLEYMQSRIPLPRLGLPEDIAGTTAFLLSDDSEWINGQIWAVDGGQTMRE